MSNDVVTFGDVVFDKVKFDRDGDVLYLAVQGTTPTHWEESPEGHVLRFTEDGRLVGVTIIGVSHHTNDAGHVQLTVPRREELDLPELVYA